MGIAGAVLTFLINLASSRMGQLLIAACIAGGWAHYQTDARWRAFVAAEKAQERAAHDAEVARQAQATQEIAAAATERAEEGAALERELRAQIEAFNTEERRGKHQVNAQKLQVDGRTPADCSIDDGFIGVVRRLDAASGKAGVAAHPRHLR